MMAHLLRQLAAEPSNRTPGWESSCMRKSWYMLFCQTTLFLVSDISVCRGVRIAVFLRPRRMRHDGPRAPTAAPSGVVSQKPQGTSGAAVLVLLRQPCGVALSAVCCCIWQALTTPSAATACAASPSPPTGHRALSPRFTTILSSSSSSLFLHRIRPQHPASISFTPFCRKHLFSHMHLNTLRRILTSTAHSAHAANSHSLLTSVTTQGTI
ncbi:hypothetical protein LIA77_00204 [Sarocladium implicatum]|nr:hypothetical protein LIA77_00204 [Sarocladium implicatum]